MLNYFVAGSAKPNQFFLEVSISQVVCHAILSNLRRTSARRDDVNGHRAVIGSQFSGKLKGDERTHAVSKKGKGRI
jgi:hypothetical protein